MKKMSIAAKSFAEDESAAESGEEEAKRHRPQRVEARMLIGFEYLCDMARDPSL
jgi:hypothetical protein